jgi:hypothetical protein
MSEKSYAPRLTQDDIDRVVIDEHYYIVPNSTVTICALYLRNGFVVVGDSACVSPINFDASIGRRIARQRAEVKVWELEGYLLRQEIAEEGL